MRRGRPRTVYLKNKVPVHTTISLEEGTRTLIPKDFNLSQFVNNVLQSLFLDKEKARKNELIQKKEELEIELAKTTIAIKEIEEKERIDKELRRVFRIEEKYPAFAFRHFIASQIKRKKGLPPITVYDEFIREKWGIYFDKEKLNHDITENDFRVDFEENLITDEELVKRYSIKKVSSQAELAHEITQAIEKEVGLS